MLTMSYPISITKTKESRLPGVDLSNLAFGKIFTDHVFIADYANGEWNDFRIEPYGDLMMSPSMSTLHYGQSIFEGLKAFKSATGEVNLFRPTDNANRLNYSAHRLAIPEIPVDLFMQAVTELVALDKNWIPQEEGASLYLRPFVFCSEEVIGIKPTENFRFMIIASPVGKYYTQPVKILVADKYVRAFHGGTGDVKACGNYGASMLPMIEAKKAGYDQVLWMDGVEFKYVHEIGSMNVFFQIGDTFITPHLDGCILDGVTRRSVIELLKQNGHKIEERAITIDELVDASNKGILHDAFGTGTAASIAPIALLGYHGKDYILPTDRPISVEIKKQLDDIRYGRAADTNGWVVQL